jgi:hypothetical protein
VGHVMVHLRVIVAHCPRGRDPAAAPVAGASVLPAHSAP